MVWIFWVLFWSYWLWAAMKSKPVAVSESLASRLFHLIPFFVGFAFLFEPRTSSGRSGAPALCPIL